MSFSFECTACGAKLKTATQPPAGKQVPCPKCKATIIVPANSLDDPSPNPPPRPQRQTPMTVDMGRRRSDEDDDDRPSTPRKLDELLPRRSSRRRDDEDDELSRRASDEFDDRRRDDDDFDRPRRRRKPQKGSKALPLLVLGLGALIIAGILFFVLFMSGSSAKADAEMLAFVPANTNAMGGIDIEDVLKQDRIKRVVDMALTNPDGQKVNQFLQGFGLTKEDLSKVMVAVNVPGNVAAGQEPDPEQMDVTFIVKLKDKTFDGNKIKTTLRATDVQKDGKTYYRTDMGSCYIPSDKIAVFCKQESTITKLLAKNGKDAELTPDLKALVDKHGGDQIWLSFADSKLMTALMNQPGAFGGMPLGGMGGGAGNAAELKNSKGIGLSGGLKGDDLKVSFSLACQNSSTSAKLATDSREQLKQLREALKALGGMGGGKAKEMDIVNEILDTVDFDSSGDLFSTSAQLDIAKLEKLGAGGMGMNPFAGMNPFGGGGGGFKNPFGGLFGGGGGKPKDFAPPPNAFPK